MIWGYQKEIRKVNKIPENIILHPHKIDLNARVKNKGYHPLLLWFTGLSGSGKSTLANAVEDYLFQLDHHTYILDGDNIRSGLNADLDFSDKSRKENIRRISEVGKLFIDAAVITLTSFISPFREDRAMARSLIGSEKFVEIFVDCPLKVCEKRDVKGLYKKARNGKIPDFTGIDSPFEIPDNPEIYVNTHLMSLEECTTAIIEYIIPKIKSGNA